MCQNVEIYCRNLLTRNPQARVILTPTKELIVDEYFSAVLLLNFDICTITTRDRQSLICPLELSNID